jgi:hypothetical protein
MEHVTYTELAVWEAIFLITPTFRTAKAAGVYLNPASSVRDALLDYFLRRELGFVSDNERDAYQYAGNILYSAHIDLCKNGMFNYAEDKKS